MSKKSVCFKISIWALSPGTPSFEPRHEVFIYILKLLIISVTIQTKKYTGV